MTIAPFTTQLRASRAPLRLGTGADTISFRVEAADLWDAVVVIAAPSTPISEVKRAAIEALLPNAELGEDFVLKLRGWEMLDQHEPIRDAGVMDGSILLLARRRRRPVR